ncbi:MAG: regulatory protein GemA [Magnetospirillum sp.]|nr:regulatory protein GemA [Magnetospirillum sp.]
MKTALDIQRARRSWFGACKKAGLDDDMRRAVQMRVCGKTSAAEMTIAEFNACVLSMGGEKTTKDTRRKSETPHARKARALWISAYHLGMVDDPREKALAAFVKRQGKVDDLRFLPPAQGTVVIDALMDMTRRAGVDWKAFKDPRRCVLSAQWALLSRAGAAPAPDLASHLYAVAGVPAFFQATERHLDALIKDLGKRVRALKGKAS